MSLSELEVLIKSGLVVEAALNWLMKIMAFIVVIRFLLVATHYLETH